MRLRLKLETDEEYLMREKDNQLSAQCKEASSVASSFITWSTENADLVGQEVSTIRREFNKYNTQLQRLSRAAERPMAVAVFGPSQSGKSYLISALARDGEKPLQAKIGDESIDFLKRINPEGGKESTGIVTRFSINQNQIPLPHAPVKTRLLDQVDLIKILGNTYLSDIDPAAIAVLDQSEIDALLVEAEQKAHPHPTDALVEHDIYDLRDYFTRNFRGVARIRALNEEFWERAAKLLPRLDAPSRGRLLSVLWGESEGFSNLYTRLYSALQKLNFTSDAYSSLGSDSVPGALLPRSKSVIDVATLSGLGTSGGDRISVFSGTGSSADLERSEYAALISELVIQIEDIPHDYFRHTDLLDFPGYRSREQIRDIDRFLSQDNGIESLFLRGKVAYLFQRYREERELTSMLLCVADSNQEVKALPEVIDGWIKDTHGETAVERADKPISLFLVLTKFDKEFDRKGGGGDTAEEYAAKWKTRLHSSLWDFFGKQHDWPFEWSSSGPFNNSFWIRNPKYEAPHLYQYDDMGRELGLLNGARDVERIEGLKQAFLSTKDVSAHFKNPKVAWDSALMPNDGGIGYLAAELGNVCDPDLKYNQLEMQFNTIKRDMLARIREFHVGDDTAELINKRIENSKNVARALLKTSQAERFGSLVSQFYVAEHQLRELYIRLDKEFSDEVIVVNEADTESDDMLSMLGLDTESKPAEEAPAEAVESISQQYAREVKSMWITALQDFIEDTPVLKYHLLNDEVAHDFIRELKAGFVRHEIEAKITEIVTNLTRVRVDIHKAIAHPTRLSANLVNDYVNYLGFQNVDEGMAPELNGRPIFQPKPFDCGPPSLTEKPGNYQNEFVADWLKAFMVLAEQNARAEGGMSVDPVSNQKLTDLISVLQG